MHNKEKKNLRTVIASVVCLMLTVSAVIPVHAAGTLSLASEAAVLMDADTGQILYEKNMHERMYPASITKVMTGMLALEALDPQKELTVSKSAVDAVPRSSSHIGLLPGEQLTVEQLMYGLAMESANDAANVIAEGVSGSLDAFAAKMNERAVLLGALDTHFTNANGLPNDEHYTTAYDMALITAEALKTPGFNQYFSTISYNCPPTNLYGARNFANKNRILPGGQYYYEGVLMGKTGWTTSAQGTLATAVRRGDTTLIVIVMKSIALENKYQDAWKLLNYGFSKYGWVNVSGEAIAEQLSLGDYMPLPGQQFNFLLNEGTDASQLSFSLGQGMSLDSGAEQTAVIINAFLNGVPLPDATMILIRKDAGQEVLAAAAAVIEPDAEDTPDEPGSGQLTGKQLSAAIWIPVVLVIVFLFLRKQYVRRQRRRHLEARIRQMKKQMEE